MNKKVFQTGRAPKCDTRNAAGGRAYSRSAEASLAQYAVTGTFNNTFYLGAQDHLETVKSLVASCSSEFIAKVAVYARRHGKMKDMPAYLLAVLAARREHQLLRDIFPIVCNNSKMLLNFAQIIRSGEVGRTSFGTAVKRLIQEWIQGRNNYALYISTIGHSNPSMADLIKMVHPRPEGEHQSAMFAYILGNECNHMLLPHDVIMFERLKKGKTTEIPNLPFRALTNCDLDVEQWKKITRQMPWNTLRQSLVLLQRRGVFEDRSVVQHACNVLSDAEQVVKYNAFPFELYATYKSCNNDIPVEIKNAIQQALEVATRNVPTLNGRTLIAVDVSGSMVSCPVTGFSNKPSIVSCVEAATLIACSLLRKNTNAKLIGFDWSSCSHYGLKNPSNICGVYDMSGVMNPFDSIVTNMAKMNYRGGGTDCSLPLQYALSETEPFDNIIMLSDNESWSNSYYRGRGAGECAAWKQYKRKYPQAKMVCVDMHPGTTVQTPDESSSVINIGGWNDAMFQVIDRFLNEGDNVNFVDVIEQTSNRAIEPMFV